jgi:hypothetical protein
MVYLNELQRELMDLRRGRALQEPELAGRLGPVLLDLSGTSEGDPDGVTRQRVRAVLDELTADLPHDLRVAAETALAFGTRSASRLAQRVQAYAEHVHCSERTARRRMDEAIRLMAQAGRTRVDAAAQTDTGSAWRIRSFTTLLRLDTPTAELFETRLVVARRALSRVEITLDLPPGPDGSDPVSPLHVDAIYGARVVEVDRSADGRHYRLVVALPRRLEPEEQAEFCLHYRVPPGQPLRNHCAIVPLQECDHGRVRVRFDPRDRPAEVWRLSGVTPRQMDQAATDPQPDRLDPDGVGEVMPVFRNLRQGHGYGVAWQPAGTAPRR